MTPYNTYRVTLPEFLRQVQVEYRHYEKLGYEVDVAAIFAELATCIHFLQKRFDYLKTQRLIPDTNIKLEEYVEISEKLERKKKKMERYNKWKNRSMKQS